MGFFDVIFFCMEKNQIKIRKNVFMLGLTSFFTDLSSEMIFPILPIFLSSILGANMAIIGLIEGVAESASSILKLFSGWLSDRFGKRKEIIIFGYSLSAISKPLFIFASHWGYVLIIRLLDRVGKGFRTAPRDALIAASSDESKRGRQFGIHRAMDTMGAVVGTLFSFFILQKFLSDAFDIIFLISAIPGFIAVSILVFAVRDVKKEVKIKKFTFNFHDCNLELKRFFLAISFFNLANFSYAFFILRANDVGISLALIPIIYLVYNIVYAVFSIPIGRWSDFFKKKTILIFGILLFALVSLGFAFFANSFTIWFLFAFYGLFMAFTDAVSRAYVSNLSNENERGFTLGTYHAIVGITVLPANSIGGLLWYLLGVESPFIYAFILSIISVFLLIFYVKS